MDRYFWEASMTPKVYYKSHFCEYLKSTLSSPIPLIRFHFRSLAQNWKIKLTRIRYILDSFLGFYVGWGGRCEGGIIVGGAFHFFRFMLFGKGTMSERKRSIRKCPDLGIFEGEKWGFVGGHRGPRVKAGRATWGPHVSPAAFVFSMGNTGPLVHFSDVPLVP